MAELPTFESTGEIRLPRKGEWYFYCGDFLQADHDYENFHYHIYRAVPPKEGRVVEQDGKRWKLVGRRVPKVGDWMMDEDSGRICKAHLDWEKEFGDGDTRDIYEPITEQTMKVTHTLPEPNPFDTNVEDMKPGSFGEDEKGIIVYRSSKHGFAFDRGTSTYFTGGVDPQSKRVRLLPRGTKITIEVE